MAEKAKIAIIGSGAIGCVMGGYLAQAGEEVILVGKKDQVLSINERGLIIEGVRGKASVSVKAVEKLEEAVDLIVLAVKTQDVMSALEQHSLHSLQCPVLTIQNGVRADKIVSQLIEQERIISSIVMFGATYLKSGEVVHNFEGDLILGNYLGGINEKVKKVSRIMERVFYVVVSEDIMGMKWLKLFVNLNNCLPALIGESMQESFADLEMCTVSIALLREGLQLVDRSGIALHSLPTYPEERLRKLATMPVNESARIFSQIMTNLSKEPLYGSILQSIRRGKPSEIDYINGEFVSLAREDGVSAPLNKKVVEMVHQVEESNRFFSSEEVIKEFRNLGIGELRN
jgi:2-dehydropantoate 2-reductase